MLTLTSDENISLPAAPVATTGTNVALTLTGGATEKRGQGHGGNSRTDRTDDARVNHWLAEYVRRRDSAESRGRRGEAALGELKAQLAHHFTPLVESIARRFVNSGEPFEDLVQEGFLGLLSGLEHYDTTKGVKFSTYATHFVAGSIRHYLRDRGKIIKEPAWLHELYGKIIRTTDTLTLQLGRTPETNEIARALNLTEESVEEVLANRQVFQVMAFETGSGEEDNSLVGVVDPEKIRSDRYVTLQLPIEDRIALEESAAKLKALEQRVLHEFFYKDLNQTEIAKKLDISCNYVSHILKNSTKKLRKIMGEAEVRDRSRTREASIVDAASGLFTQSHILARLDEELSRAARTGQSTAAVVIVINGLPSAYFRREEVWSVCGDAVRRCIRRVDMAGRYGEDSLLVVLPSTGEQTTLVAERLTNVLLAVGAAHHVQFLVGCGQCHAPEQGRTSAELLETAEHEARLCAEEVFLLQTLPTAA